MKFSLNKTNLKLLVSAFRQDRMTKRVTKVAAHGLHAFFGTLEARDGELRIVSGRVKLILRADVEVAGAFAIRDQFLRELLLTLRDDPGLQVGADSTGLRLNGVHMIMSATDYRFECSPNK